MREYKSFYKTVTGNEGDKCIYSTRLDTYGCGCQHDCSYCYAKSLLDFRNLWNPLDPSVADTDKIRKTIGKIKPGSVVRLGGMTDCFQPIEKSCMVTFETIKALNERGVHYLIVTKSDLVADDKYMRVMDKNLAHIQITVTTFDDDLYKRLKYEKAPLPSKRIEAIRKLYRNGFDVSLRLSPYIPSFVDYEALSKTGCDKLLVEFLRVNPWIKRWFGEYINIDEYTVKENGYLHLPLDRKIELIDKIYGFPEITVCEDESEAYEFWKTFNPNKNDCCNLRMK